MNGNSEGKAAIAAESPTPIASVATGRERRAFDVADRLELLEGNVALVAEAVATLTPILAALNGELVRTGVLPQADGLANQDKLGLAANLTVDALTSMPPGVRHTPALTGAVDARETEGEQT